MRQSVRLAIAFFMLSTLPVALVSYISIVNAERTVEREIENHLRAITEMRAADFGRWLGSLERTIESIAQRPMVVDLTADVIAQTNQQTRLDPSSSSELVAAHLLPHLKTEGLFETFSIVDARTGKVLVSTEAEQVGMFRIGETYFEEGRNGTFVGQVRFVPALEALALHVSTPIRRDGEETSAILVGRGNLRTIAEIIASADDIHESGDVYLVNRFGFFVTEPRFGDGFALQRLAITEGVEAALAGGAGVARYRDYRGVSVVGAYQWLPDEQMALIAEIDQAEAFAAIRPIRTLGLTLMVGAIVAFAGLGILLSRTITHPLRRIAAGAEKIGRGEFGHRIASTRRDEFGDLSRAFDRMAENLQRITASRDDLHREMARRREVEERLRETVSALRESEERFRRILGNIPDIVYRYRAAPTLGFDYISPAVFDIVGYTPEEFYADPWLIETVVHPEDLRPLENLIRGEVKTETREVRWVHKDGHEIWLEDRFVPIRDDAGGLVAVEGVARDVSAWKRAMVAQETADDIVRSLPTGLLTLELDSADRFIISSANPSATAAIAEEGKSLAGKRLEEVFPGPMIPKATTIFRKVVENGRVQDTEVVIRSTEGIRFAVHVRAFPIPGGRIVAAFEDITSQKRAEEALRVSEQQLRSLFENSALGIYRTTPDGRILTANPALFRMLGYDSFEDLAHRNLEEDGYEPETPREHFKQRIERTGRLEGAESIWITKDGERVFVRENAVAVRDSEGEILFYEGTVEDITELRRLEVQLQQSQRLESIGTLASGIAHEINNPLTGMISYAELMGRRVGDDRLKEYADAIMSEGARVAKIVRNLLSFARQEKESHSPARLTDIVSSALRLIGVMIRKDGIRIDAGVPEDLPKVKCRSQQIQQVFVNLLANARDALNERYPTGDENKSIRITAREVTEANGHWIRTIVEDRGKGIPEDEIDRIFDPFFTTKPRDRGTGLGLSVSYGIVRDHGGRLTVESEVDSYTRFTLDLPINNGWNSSDGDEDLGGANDG